MGQVAGLGKERRVRGARRGGLRRAGHAAARAHARRRPGRVLPRLLLRQGMCTCMGMRPQGPPQVPQNGAWIDCTSLHAAHLYGARAGSNLGRCMRSASLHSCSQKREELVWLQPLRRRACVCGSAGSDSVRQGTPLFDLTTSSAAVEVGGGPWWSTWKAQVGLAN